MALGTSGPSSIKRFTGRDGLELSYRETGTGDRPVILLHGFAASGTQWLDHGPAGTLAKHGHRVILPDLRGHGPGAGAQDRACYPPDILTDDGLAMIDHLGVDDYDLGGYSLGAAVVLRMLARGARPARAILAGQGLAAVTRTVRGGVTRGFSPHSRMEARSTPTRQTPKPPTGSRTSAATHTRS